MEKNYYSLEEANALIPYLKPMLIQLRVLKSELNLLVSEAEKNGLEYAQLMNEPSDDEAVVAMRARVEEIGDQVAVILDEIQEKGVVVKDIDRGLVDFYCRIHNEDVFLCWQCEEDEIQFWHGVNEGFAQRQSLFKRAILEDVAKVH